MEIITETRREKIVLLVKKCAAEFLGAFALKSIWIYILAPIGGSLLAAFSYKFLFLYKTAVFDEENNRKPDHPGVTIHENFLDENLDCEPLESVCYKSSSYRQNRK